MAQDYPQQRMYNRIMVDTSRRSIVGDSSATSAHLDGSLSGGSAEPG
jgi:hypothetical protein